MEEQNSYKIAFTILISIIVVVSFIFISYNIGYENGNKRGFEDGNKRGFEDGAKSGYKYAYEEMKDLIKSSKSDYK